MIDCKTRLAEAKNILNERLTGTQERSVGYETNRVEYFETSIGDLQRYISNLEIECGDGSGIRRGPVRFYG